MLTAKRQRPKANFCSTERGEVTVLSIQSTFRKLNLRGVRFRQSTVTGLAQNLRIMLHKITFKRERIRQKAYTVKFLPVGSKAE